MCGAPSGLSASESLDGRSETATITIANQSWVEMTKNDLTAPSPAPLRMRARTAPARRGVLACVREAGRCVASIKNRV